MPNHHGFIRFYYPQNFDEAMRMIVSLRDEVKRLEEHHKLFINEIAMKMNEIEERAKKVKGKK